MIGKATLIKLLSSMVDDNEPIIKALEMFNSGAYEARNIVSDEGLITCTLVSLSENEYFVGLKRADYGFDHNCGCKYFLGTKMMCKHLFLFILHMILVEKDEETLALVTSI